MGKRGEYEKINNIQWLFFDVGSTLVSEEKPFLHRLHEIAEAVNEPFETIQGKVLQLYKEKKKGERVLIAQSGMENPRWRSFGALLGFL